MSFSIIKFLGGFAFWKGEKAGKLLYVLLIVVVCLGAFWKIFLSSSQVDKSSQKAQTITNITQEQVKDDSIFFGIKVSGIRIGISVR